MNPNQDPASAIERVWRYHDVTKHRLEAYARGPAYLDWDSQPDPFRRWHDAPCHPLPLVDDGTPVPFAALYADTQPMSVVDERSLAHMLELAFGLSAWKRLGPDRWALRCNPSSGNLHPTEVYLILWRSVSPDLGSGLYHYAPYDHALERRATLPTVVAETLAARHSASFGAVGLSSIVWREAWKYGARALRYCQLDVGHAVASLRYAAGVLGWTASVDAQVADDTAAHVLGLQRGDDLRGAETEIAELLIVLGDQDVTPPDWAALAGALCDWRGVASRLGEQHVEWHEIDAVLPALTKPVTAARRRVHAVPEREADVPDGPRDAAALIRSRRSAQRMDGASRLDLTAFCSMLKRTLPQSLPVSSLAVDTAVHLLLFVHAVEGLEPGLYVLVRDDAALPALQAALRPQGGTWQREAVCDVPLYRLLAPCDVRHAAAHLSCHQAIAGKGVFAVAMLAEFLPVLQRDGAWAWKRLHWEAGAIGQVLYLEAEAQGLRGTGIGCFFDDEVHAVLGLPDTTRPEWQVVYHFTVGGAVDDARLATEPAYAHLAAQGRVRGAAT